jgi:cupin 2 domain-containing protein
MIKVRNFFRDLPRRTGEREPIEHIEEILSKGKITIERIVTYGRKPTEEGKWYDDSRNEFVMVLSGATELLFEEGNQRVIMERGDYINIPAHKKHRVEMTRPNGNTLWLAVYY